MMNSRALLPIAAALSLVACGDDTIPAPIPEPDLVVSGRLVDDTSQPLQGGTVEAWLVAIPAEPLSSGAAWVAPSCDGAIVPTRGPDDDAQTAADGGFVLNLIGLDAPMCLLVRAREANQPADLGVLLAPRLVSPAATAPATVGLGDIAIGLLDQARD